MKDPATAKRIRGWILQFLAEMPQDGTGKRTEMSSDLLTSQLRATGLKLVREEVEVQLAYLADRGYVETHSFKGRAAHIMQGAISARITSKGQDVVEATTEDPGIDLGGLGG